MLSFAHLHAYSYGACLKKLDEVELVGIADENEKRGQEAAKQYATRYFRDYQQLLEQGLDAVVICSENSRHKELTLAAAERGLPVLCEKPIAATLTDATEMIRVCKDKGVKLGTAFPCRYGATSKRTKSLLDQGAIGDVVAIMSTNHGRMPGGWFTDKKLAGGGAVIDHTVHVVDLMRWMLGKEVKEVYAEMGTLIHPIEVEDCGLLTMKLENGIFATLDASWSRPKVYPIWGDVTMEFIGTKGVLSFDLLSQNLSVYEEKDRRVCWDSWGDNLDLLMMQDFTQRIANDQPLWITGEDGLKALEVALAAYESFEKGEPVQLGKMSSA